MLVQLECTIYYTVCLHTKCIISDDKIAINIVFFCTYFKGIIKDVSGNAHARLPIAELKSSRHMHYIIIHKYTKGLEPLSILLLKTRILSIRHFPDARAYPKPIVSLPDSRHTLRCHILCHNKVKTFSSLHFLGLLLLCYNTFYRLFRKVKSLIP